MKKLISLVIAVALMVCMLPVIASAEATALQLSTTEYSSYEDEWINLYAYDENGYDFTETITWTSSDPAVATIDSGWGNTISIHLLTQGTATITAECGGLSATCTITVLPPEVLTLDTPLTLDKDVLATFTPAEAGTYTIYVPESNCNLSGYVTSNTGYSEFAFASDGRLRAATITLEADEVCYIYAWALINSDDIAPSYKLSAVKTPATEGLALNTDKVELIYIGSGFYAEGSVYLNPSPITAAIPAELTWKMKDETVAELNYAYNGVCYFGALKVGETVLEVYDGETLIDSVQIVVKSAEDVAQQLYWGVEYDIDATADQVYMFTPTVTDTYTFKSDCEEDTADPCLNILTKEESSGQWVLYNENDDYNYSLNFYLEAQLEKDVTYMIVVSTLNAKPGYSFSMKGTDVSNPGYDLKKIAANGATCTVDGNIEYYECQKTGLKFLNAEATKLAGDVTVKAEGHKFDKVAEVAATTEKEGTKAHEKCSVCGALVIDGKEAKAEDLVIAKLVVPVDPSNPATGDTTMVLPFFVLVVLSAMGLAATCLLRKKER